MAKKQKNNMQEKTVAVLKQDVVEARKELFQMGLDNQMRKLKNTRGIFLKRKEISRMLTAIKAKEVANG